MRALWLGLIALAVLLASPATARGAFVVPPIEGHVTDPAGVLTPEERADLEQRLAAHMARSGAEIAVFLVGSLQGETIEDVAYRTFNTWRIGREKLDNGVLLVIAPKERRLRIETGKGIGGQLTDLQASDIIEQRIVPELRAGRTHDAVAAGVDAIAAALASPSRPPETIPPTFLMGALVLLLILAFVLRRFFFLVPWFWWGGRGGGGGGGGFFGGGGGGGYSGGGGRSGGGGASGGW
jgi:uncharacterized protein